MQLWNVDQGSQHCVQVLAGRSDLAHEEREWDSYGKTQHLAIGGSRRELSQINAIRDDMYLPVWNPNCRQLFTNLFRHRHYDSSLAEGLFFPARVQHGVEVLIQAVWIPAQPCGVDRRTQPGAVHEVCHVHVGRCPGNKAIHVDHIKLVTVSSEPAETLPGKNLIAQQPRRQACFGYSYPGNGWMCVQLSSDLAGYKDYLVPASEDSPCYLVVYSALSVALKYLTRHESNLHVSLLHLWNSANRTNVKPDQRAYRVTTTREPQPSWVMSTPR